MAESAATSTLAPFPWFHGNATEAVNFYLSIFPGARRTGEMATPEGKPLTIGFDLLGTHFTALNGDREYVFNNSISFVVTCDDQVAIDYYWAKLTGEGGKEGRCGWLTDKFGVAWQVVPRNLADMLKPPAAMAALLKMYKLDISTFEAAARALAS